MSTKYKFHNPNGLYFTSTSIFGWADVFTRIIYKDIIVDSLKYCQAEKGLELYAWCIMTNHIHLIFSTNEDVLPQDFIRDFKKFTSKALTKAIKENDKESRKERWLALFERGAKYNSNNTFYQFWQQNNRPIELWSNEVIQQKIDYVHDNPVKAGIVYNAEDYVYSSAIDYTGIEGLIKLEIEY